MTSFFTITVLLYQFITHEGVIRPSETDVQCMSFSFDTDWKMEYIYGDCSITSLARNMYIFSACVELKHASCYCKTLILSFSLVLPNIMSLQHIVDYSMIFCTIFLDFREVPQQCFPNDLPANLSVQQDQIIFISHCFGS